MAIIKIVPMPGISVPGSPGLDGAGFNPQPLVKSNLDPIVGMSTTLVGPDNPFLGAWSVGSYVKVINSVNTEEFFEGTITELTPGGVVVTIFISYVTDTWTREGNADVWTMTLAGARGADALWNFLGEYNDGADYNIGDVVTYNGGTYYRILPLNSGYAPGTEYWTTVAAPGSSGGGGDTADFIFTNNYNDTGRSGISLPGDKGITIAAGEDSDLYLTAGDDLYIQTLGSGDDIHLNAADDIRFTTNNEDNLNGDTEVPSWRMDSEGRLQLPGDGYISNPYSETFVPQTSTVFASDNYLNDQSGLNQAYAVALSVSQDTLWFVDNIYSGIFTSPAVISFADGDSTTAVAIYDATSQGTPAVIFQWGDVERNKTFAETYPLTVSVQYNLVQYGASTIVLDPQWLDNDQKLVIDATTPNHIHLRAGGEIDNSSADIFLGGEDTHVMVSDQLGSVEILGTNVTISSNAVPSSLNINTYSGARINSVRTSTYADEDKVVATLGDLKATDIKESVKVATDSAFSQLGGGTGGPASGGGGAHPWFTTPGVTDATIDGVVVSAGDRVLVKDVFGNNGIFNVVEPTTGYFMLEVASDAIPEQTLTKGAIVFVESGSSTNKGFVAQVYPAFPPLMPTASVYWSQFSESGFISSVDTNHFIAGGGSLALNNPSAESGLNLVYGDTFTVNFGVVADNIGIGTGITTENVNSVSAIAIDTDVVTTLDGTQTLINKTIDSPNIINPRVELSGTHYTEVFNAQTEGFVVSGEYQTGNTVKLIGASWTTLDTSSLAGKSLKISGGDLYPYYGYGERTLISGVGAQDSEGLELIMQIGTFPYPIAYSSMFDASISSVNVLNSIISPTELSYFDGVTSNIQDQLNLKSEIHTETTFTVNGGTLGTQPTFSGPPMFSGSYVKTGPLVHFQIQVDMDNITSFGTGQFYVDLPFPAKYGYKFREGCLHDISTGRDYAVGGHVFAGQSQLTLTSTDTQSGTVFDIPFVSNNPIILANADNFHISGTYISL